MTSKGTTSRDETNELLFERASKSWDEGRLLSAFRLFMAGAKAGDTGAQFNLGYFYAAGIGVKRNKRRAVFWYQRAYRKGFAAAASNIAALFLAEADMRGALKWYHRAITLHDADANLAVAKIYVRDGRNFAEIEPYLRRAIEAPPDEITQAARKEAELILRSPGKPRSSRKAKLKA